MAEPTLNMAYQELQEKLGDWLGYGRGETADERPWTDKQRKAVLMLLKMGVSDFYYCGHKWSFLRPVATLTLASGASTLALPDDFGGVEGQVVLNTSGGQASWWPIDFGPIGDVYQRAAESPEETGRPCRCCLEPVKGVTLDHGGRQRLRFQPTADQEYLVKFQYYVNPDFLSGSKPYAYGGPQHAGTLLQACIAAAERRDGLLNGPEQLEYQRKLKNSIDIDGRQKPQHYGYNGDRSEWAGYERPARFLPQVVTIGGVDPND